MENSKYRNVNTGLYTNIGMGVLDSVIGQMSDGLWGNSPVMEGYWRFVKIDRSANGEVIIKILNQRDEGDFCGNRWKWCTNKFYDMTDDMVREFFAKKIKAIAKEEIKDNDNRFKWDRHDETVLNYITREDGNINVGMAYMVYENLLGRIIRIDKYCVDIEKVIGYPANAEKTATRENILNEIAKLEKELQEAYAKVETEFKEKVAALEKEKNRTRGNIWSEHLTKVNALRAQLA